jgi:hypothetical protein
MIIRLQLCVVLLFVGLLSPQSANAKDESEKARALLQASAERSLFHADRNAPFGLLFTFELRIFGSKPTRGAYSWVVTPQGDSRQETKLLDYSDLEINRGTTLWIKRSADYRPWQAIWVESAFSNFLYLNRSEDEVTHYWTTSERHVELRCIDLLRDKAARTLCFDSDNNLRKVEIKDSYTVYEFSDFRAVGTKICTLQDSRGARGASCYRRGYRSPHHRQQVRFFAARSTNGRNQAKWMPEPDLAFTQEKSGP